MAFDADNIPMKNMNHATLILLTIGITATATAAPDEVPGQTSPHEGASLAELVNEMVDLQAEKESLGTALTAKITEILPKGSQPYGEFDWRTVFTVDYIAANAMDSEGRQHAAVQLHVHPSVDAAFRKRFSEECHGYPARRFKDKWVRVLVGRTEIRLSATNKELQSITALDSIIESFDLKTIGTL